MKESKMMQERDFYVRNAKNLESIRPICHAASAITTALFCVVWLLRQDFAITVIDSLGWASYALAFAIIAFPVYFLESKISALIDDFAHSIATLHSYRLAILMGVIVLPFIMLSGATSFVGVSEPANQLADAIHSESITELSKSLSIDQNESLVKREENYRNERKEQRFSIIEKYNIQLSKVDKSNKLKYKDWQSNDWHAQQLSKYNLRDSNRIESNMRIELERFDKETNKVLSETMKTHNELNQSAAISKAVLVETGTTATVEKTDRWKWLGKFFGFIVVIVLFISLLCAIGKHFICAKFNIKDVELKTLKKK